MVASLRHRGPDDDGLLLRPGVGLGMRRLSIIDLAGGQQPIRNEDGSAWVVFNGEIYNYRDMRDTLRQLGHMFYTESDTEVIVHAYEEYGVDCLDHLNGMFAFAVWDERRRRLFLARDRFGIKPLYYTDDAETFAFGSELKALLARPGQARDLDLVSLRQYLTLEHIPPPRSIVKGIRKLPAGHYLVYDEDGTTVRRYWDVDLAASETSHVPDLAEAKVDLLERLREAVRLELISDVPLGVFLSGGIDSSAVAAMMCELIPGQVRTFSVGFEDPSFDESRYAELVAKRLGTEHHALHLEPRALWELAPRVPDILDEPMADASIIPTYVLCRFAREHVKVALGGDGGDELLAGYSTLQAHRLTQYYQHVPSLVRHGLIRPVVDHLPVSMNNMSFDFKAKRFVRDAERPTAVRHQLWLGCFRPEDMPGLLSPDVEECLRQTDPLQPAHDYLANCRARHDLNRVLHLDLKTYMESDILVKVDRASMANSLEVRVPLLNRVFADYAIGLPLDLKLRFFTRKFIFREALRGKLPDEIIARKKHGFGMPIGKWLRDELRDLAADSLSESRIRESGLFQPEYVAGLLSDHLEGRQDNRKQLWTLLVFQLWLDRYLAGGNTSNQAEASGVPYLAE